MSCPLKPIKHSPTKTSSIDRAWALPDRPLPPETLTWSPLISGPFIVPVTRWVE